MQLAAAAGEREPGGDVQQPVTQPFRFGLRELAVKHEGLGPDDQVVREHHDLQPHLVHRERLERQLAQAGVLVVTDPVLNAGALAVTTFQDGDVRIGLVGEDRLEAVPVVVGERQLRARVRTLATDNQPGPIGPGAEIEAVGDLDDFAVLAFGAVLVQRRDPVLIRGLKDCSADCLGQLVAEGEPQVPVVAVVGGLVSRRPSRPGSGSPCPR